MAWSQQEWKEWEAAALVPHVFRDGRAGKYWYTAPGMMDFDGPYETEAEAQHALDRYLEGQQAA